MRKAGSRLAAACAPGEIVVAAVWLAFFAIAVVGDLLGLAVHLADRLADLH